MQNFDQICHSETLIKCTERNVILIQTERDYGLTTLLINTLLLDIHYIGLIKILDLVEGEL